MTHTSSHKVYDHPRAKIYISLSSNLPQHSGTSCPVEPATHVQEILHTHSLSPTSATDLSSSITWPPSAATLTARPDWSAFRPATSPESSSPDRPDCRRCCCCCRCRKRDSSAAGSGCASEWTKARVFCCC